jgi:hypothetical protein
MRWVRRVLWATAIGLVAVSQSVMAQQVAVQQPVVGRTGVSTSVSVPDRGSTRLGGVGSAQSSRSSFGRGRPGSSVGMSRSSSSMSASVYIHDLRAMDEAILNSVPDSPSSSNSRSSSMRSPGSDDKPAEASSAEKASKFERLAQKAESDGSPRVAKLHWQMAAKYGSSLAKERLSDLPTTSSDKPSTSSVGSAP